jgi:hypothetical protein
MKPRHAAVLALWNLLIPPVLTRTGWHTRSLNAPLNKWYIVNKYYTQPSCERDKERMRADGATRIRFGREHPDLDPKGDTLVLGEAWQLANCVNSNDPRLKPK